MPPLARPTRPRQPCRRVASTIWRMAEPATKPPRPKIEQRREARWHRAATATTMVRPPPHADHTSRWRMVSMDALRHGSTGAMPMRNSSAMTMGPTMRLK